MKRRALKIFLSELLFAAFMLACAVEAFARDLPDFTQLVEQYGPAVVNISTTQKVASKVRRLPHLEIPDLPEDSPFREFFRRFFGEEKEGEGEIFEEKPSLGSGFIISEDGYILSNYHVVKDAEEIVVRLSDRRELVAKVLGTDERSDIALLKVEAKNLPVVKIGRSESLKVGEWVLAIGSPFGFEHSVTAGIVSAKGRSLPNENYVSFIQTDVAINPGNSGGPLFNLDGEVVGVNSQIYSRTGGFMGLSFAIPIDVAMEVVHQLKAKGYVSRGWLGVLIQDVSRDLAESFGVEKPQGAAVAQVLPESPAERAGMKVGDVIVEYAGKRVVRSSDLPPIVGRSPIGKPVDVKIIRDKKPITIQVTIGELPNEQELKLTQGSSRSSAENRIGVAVKALTDEQREELKIDKPYGVLVTEVTGEPARRAGISQGDIILMLDNQEVQDVKHFKELVKNLPKGRAVPVLVQRSRGPIFLALKLND